MVHGDIWNFKGNALDHLGRNEDALVAYEKAININPKDEFAWYFKGNALLNAGDKEGAREAFKVAIELNPVKLKMPSLLSEDHGVN